MKSNTFRFTLLIIVIIVVVAVAAALFSGQPRTGGPVHQEAQEQGSTITNVSHPNDVPTAISKYFDLSGYETYDPQVRAISDGSTQSIVNFKTSDLQGAHAMALDVLTKNGFTVGLDDAESSTFSLSGAKGSERLQIMGFAESASSSSSSTAGSVTIIYLHKI